MYLLISELMITSIRHVGLVVKDLNRSLKFYCDLLGLSIYSRHVEEKGQFIDKLVSINNVVVEWVKLNIPGGGLIELLQYHSHPDADNFKDDEYFPSNRLGCSHIAFTVHDLFALYNKLIQKGYKCNSEPLIAPSGKIKILYCHDPDGIILEMIEQL